MKCTILLIATLICPTFLLTQPLTLQQIRISLLNNPPGTGDPVLRERTLMSLDSILIKSGAYESQRIIDFYVTMMEKVNTEIQDTVVSGATIWMMYNHGFVVKTPRLVFAFDLVGGWWWDPNLEVHLPSELLYQINVLFISHYDIDHNDKSVYETVISQGGYVIVPAEIQRWGMFPMTAGDSTTIMGLRIKAHDGLHGDKSVRIFEVTTSSGLTILHTGDNQTSETLPEVDSLDVLLLNAWVNESGSMSSVDGMRNCIARLNPALMIPGHFHELGHSAAGWTNPSKYRNAFEVDDVPMAAEVIVMAWGERYSTTGAPVGVIEDPKMGLHLQAYSLLQNYPNPFNPVSTIRYELPQASDVSLIVYDIIGREVAKLVEDYMEAGYHEVQWNGQNFASGIYIARLVTPPTAGQKAPEYSKSIKMVLLK